MTTAVQIHQVTQIYQQGKTQVKALRDISLTIPQGQFVAIMGASGSGKSTLLHLMAGLVHPTQGEIQWAGQSSNGMRDDDITRFRRRHIGLVFQSFNLLPTMSALENVMLPLMIAGQSKNQIRVNAEKLLQQVSLGDRMHHRPDELSGGEQQRVAIARALINQAPLLLADEPTGNLDSNVGEQIMHLLRELVENENRTLVMVTHDPRAAAYADRVITLNDGQVIKELNTEVSSLANLQLGV